MIKSEREYLKKLDFLKQNDKFYFENSSPKISDAEYDILKNELIAFEKINNKFNFVSNKVGFVPSEKFSKIKHSEKMLSLDNAFQLNDIINFFKSY